MINLKSAREIECIRRAGKIGVLVLNRIKGYIEPGITTKELEYKAMEVIIDNNGKPAFKGYQGYPANICTSVNEEVIHGIPGNRLLNDGDIVSVDVGIGCDIDDVLYFADTAATFPVGNIIDEQTKKLLEVSKKALYLAIDECKINNRVGDISWTVQSYVESNGFSVVRDFVGHGIGRTLHEDPQIPNFGKPGHGPRLKSGMVFCIEPMVNIGEYNVKVLNDKWTVVTQDGSRSAHFEHTVVITDNGVEILTK